MAKRLRLDTGHFGWDYYLREVYDCGNETGREIYIDSDWDYAFTAHLFGWTPICNYDPTTGEYNGSGCGTDGTVDCHEDCPRPHSVSYHLSEASNYLDDHIGETRYDPGYFG